VASGSIIPWPATKSGVHLQAVLRNPQGLAPLDGTASCILFPNFGSKPLSIRESAAYYLTIAEHNSYSGMHGNVHGW
jgi:hypothetical protein